MIRDYEPKPGEIPDEELDKIKMEKALRKEEERAFLGGLAEYASGIAGLLSVGLLLNTDEDERSDA